MELVDQLLNAIRLAKAAIQDVGAKHKRFL
jgi:hypothetical protein